MRPTQDPEWLVLRAQSGDRQALEALLVFTQRRLAPYVGGMLDDADEAADVLQGVLITICRKLGALREPRAYLAWGRRIASRAVYETLRRRRAAADVHDELHPELLSLPEPAMDAAEIAHDLPALLARVSPASREVLILHYLQQLSLEEIATILAIPLGTVKSRLGYGLRVLRQLANPASANPPLGATPAAKPRRTD